MAAPKQIPDVILHLANKRLLELFCPSGSHTTMSRYRRTPEGLLVQSLDFRTRSDHDDGDVRPSLPAGHRWRDTQFGLHDAITNQETSQDVTWRRPSVSIILIINIVLFSSTVKVGFLYIFVFLYAKS